MKTIKIHKMQMLIKMMIQLLTILTIKTAMLKNQRSKINKMKSRQLKEGLSKTLAQN
jgi:hypothetical protein